jgi:periplasmic mercuric ion binding protein
MKKLMLISGVGILIYLSAQVCGCGSCKASATDSEITTSVKKGNKTVQLKITGMTCAGCSDHVTQTLESVKGVSKVDLEYPGDVATVEYDATKTNKEELIAAVEKINYNAEEVKTKK